MATRKEQRKVTETIVAILCPLIPHLKEDEADAVQTAITILQEIEIEKGGEMMIGGNNITFKTSKKINKWIEEHIKECQTHATAGEQFVFEFLPSGIVECQTVKCLCCGKDYTDYVD